jgi:2'-5' RNA ligase
MEVFIEASVFSKPVLIPPVNNEVNILIADKKQLYEYLLLLSPYGFTRERIITEKKYFSEMYGNADAAHSLPHITLANFILSQFNQDKITCLLETIAQRSNRIKVVLENYKWFPHHTIYIDVKYKIDIKQLVRKITKGIKGPVKADNKYYPYFILNPHLTLCKRLDREQYEKSVIEYTRQNFSDAFTANEMLLLRRPLTEPGNYKQVARFTFGGPEVCDTTMQLSLF